MPPTLPEERLFGQNGLSRCWSGNTPLADLCFCSPPLNSKRAEAKLKDVGGKLEEKKVEVKPSYFTLALTPHLRIASKALLTFWLRRPLTDCQLAGTVPATNASGGRRQRRKGPSSRRRRVIGFRDTSLSHSHTGAPAFKF